MCGLEDAIIQRRLLSDDNLSYEKAVEIVNAMELASTGSKQLFGQQPPSVNKLFNPTLQPPKHPQKTECYEETINVVQRGTLVKPAVLISQHQIRNLRFMNCTTCLIENVNHMQ